MTLLSEVLTTREVLGYCTEQSAADWPDAAAITSALAAAVGRRWPADDLQAIADYARTGVAAAATAMPPLYAEAVLRAARGETHLLMGLPREYHLTWSVELLVLLTADEQEQ
ncbi:hypothetical protein HPO96_18510 [Kribbella sandramycini]|uniref:Uncharacterized protein n=1 Tax=Kribbella sandramycini TaxID=60450 RepID=A0A7Y4NZN1_9ACTN|nr:hypothetical protein [Kribbella sandramycini]MBB6564538.1 hypothetical protein [Kribbella sandramycini]NOL42242.1 hypothetical protein [Kribbella sandramycini]